LLGDLYVNWSLTLHHFSVVEADDCIDGIADADIDSDITLYKLMLSFLQFESKREFDLVRAK
jgi:hypothetical protein